MPKTKFLIIEKRKDFPKCLRDHKQIKAISIGKCIGINHLDRRGAHAHTDPTDKHYGWVCLSMHSQLRERFTLLHELAHFMVSPSKPSHGKDWRKAVVKLGGTYKAFHSYHKDYEYEDYSPKW